MAFPIVEMGWVMVLMWDILVCRMGRVGGLVIGKVEMGMVRMGELFLNNVMREIVSLGVGGIILRRRNMSGVTIHAELDGHTALMGTREGF